MDLAEWLFWCKIPLHITFGAATISIYLVMFMLAHIAAKFTDELVQLWKGH